MTGGTMSARVLRLVFWAPRVLCLLFAVFLGLFALDVFGEGRGPWETVAALLIHLAPVYVVLAGLLAAWRRPGLGAALFGGLAAFYLAWGWGRVHWTSFLAIALPLALVAVLFAFDWRYGRRPA